MNLKPKFRTYSTMLLGLSFMTLGCQSTMKNKEIKFLWQEEVYNKEVDAEVSMLVVNTDYLKTISDPEKAALGYVATFIGNECRWDGEPTSSRSNLKCKILSALDLGYQCSDTHLGFLRKWFAGDTVVLERLEGCPTIPETATVQSGFDSIDIQVSGDRITVQYVVSGFNMRESKGWIWQGKDDFRVDKDHIRLVKSEKSEPVIQVDVQEIF